MPVAGTIVANVVARTGNFTAGMTKVGIAMDKVSVKVDRLASKFLKWGATAGAAFSGMVVKLAMDAEKTRMSIVQLTGSSEKAKKMLQEMADFAAATPFMISDLEKSTQTLLAYAVETEKVTGTVKFLGDVAAASGNKILDIAKVFGKVVGEGRAFQERLNQINDKGIPIIDALKKKLKMGGLEFRDFVQKGGVTADMFIETLQEMTEEGGVFFKAAERQAKTLAGRWSTLVSNVELLGRAIGDELRWVVVSVVDELIKWLKANKDLIKSLALGALKTIAFSMYLAVAAKVMIRVVKVGRWIVKVMKDIRTGQIAILGLSGPAGWAVLAVGLGIAVAGYIGMEYAIDKTSEALKKNKSAAADATAGIEDARIAAAKFSKDQIETAKDREKALNEELKNAKRIAKERQKIQDEHRKNIEKFARAVETPMETHNRLVHELNETWQKGGMSLEIYRRTMAKYRKDLKDGLSDQKQFNREMASLHLAPSHDPRTVSGMSAFLKGGAEFKARKKQAQIARDQLAELQQINANTAEPLQVHTGGIF